MAEKCIDIIVPIYNEESNIKILYSTIVDICTTLPAYSWRYVFVNDGSPDNSLAVLRELASQDNRICVIDLSRNFGKEIALTAGAHEAENADAIICIDADLQHPPELIPKLVHEWESGAEIVATVRLSTDRQPFLRKVGSHFYYWLMAKISGLDIRTQTTDFRLYDKLVVAAFRHATERERMFRGIMDWMGFRRVYVEFHANARHSGGASYSYKKLVKLAVGSITSFSLFPLRLTNYLGFSICLGSSLLLFLMLLDYIFTIGLNFSPLAIVVVANTFLIGIVLLSIGMVAMYVGTIHTEVINRPLYIIRERIVCADKS